MKRPPKNNWKYINNRIYKLLAIVLLQNAYSASMDE